MSPPPPPRPTRPHLSRRALPVRIRLPGWALIVALGCVRAEARGQSAPADDLPTLRVATGGAVIVDEPKVLVRLTANHPDGTPGYAGPAGIEIRGRSSQAFPKKSYGLELRGVDGRDSSAALLGLPPDDDWVLHGPYADRALLRNALSYATARATGRYAPRTRYCHLEIDGAYQGVYLLTERVQPAPHKVDITPAPPATAPERGDYLFAVDFEREGPASGWVSPHAGPRDGDYRFKYQYVRPRPGEITAPQARYLEAWVGDLEAALLADDDFGLDLEEFLDVDAWIDYVLVNELAFDVDAYSGSTFLVKRGGGRLAPGPVWDHNLAWGNADFAWGDPGACERTAGFAIDSRQTCVTKLVPVVFGEVWRRPEVRLRAARRWAELRRGAFGPGLDARLDSLAAALAVAQDRNFARWPIHGEYLWPNEFAGETWRRDVDYLASWVARRRSWLDGAFARLDAELSPGDRPEGPSWRLAPNPASSSAGAVVAFDRPLRSAATVEILDASGRVVRSRTVAGPYRSRPLGRGLSPGLYVLRVAGADPSVRRLVVSGA